MRFMIGMLLVLVACDDATSNGSPDPATGCLEAELIAQCPPGSNPILGATADGLCEGGQRADLMNMEGHVTGRCYGESGCVVACQFAAACRCGVASITRDGVSCVPCEDVDPCGDGECAGGETPQTCPEDCAGDCVPGEMRCQGAAIESCNLRGRWEAIACPRGEVCAQDPGQPPRCERDDIVMGDDMGVDAGGGPRISGRIQFFDAPVPQSAPVVREGSGRGLVPLGHWGLIRRCSGNDAQVARCRQAGNERPRYRLVGRQGAESAGFVYRLTVDAAGALLLWGGESILHFGYDGLAPIIGDPPSLEAFCAAHAPACAGVPEPDCVNAPPEATRQAYESWLAGPAAMRCAIAQDPVQCVPNGDCLVAERVRGYGPDQTMRGVLDGVHSADGTQLVFWADATHVAVFDLTTGVITPIGDTGAYMARGRGGSGLAISADNQFVGAVAQIAEGNAIALVWPRAGGEPVAAVPLDFGSPTEIALSSDGSALAVKLEQRGRQPTPAGIEIINVAEQARSYRILPLDEPNPPNRACFPHPGGGLAFSPAGNVLAVGAPAINGAACVRTSIIELWDVVEQAKVGVLTGPLGTSNVVRFSPDGSTLAVGSTVDGGADLRLWDAESGALVEALSPVAAQRWGASVDGLEYSPDGRFLTVWGAGGVGDFTTTYGGVLGPAELAPPEGEE